MILFVLRHPRDGRDLPIPEMPGEEQDPFSLLPRLDEVLTALDPDEIRLFLIRQEGEAEKLQEKFYEMTVKGLRDFDNLRFCDSFAKDSSEVFHDHFPPQREKVIDGFSIPRHQHRR